MVGQGRSAERLPISPLLRYEAPQLLCATFDRIAHVALLLGHGGQTKDLDGDEEDGYDEVIYPSDFTRNGHIVDDQIHAICVASLQPGVRLTCIFDSCHSGSVMDLPYVYSTKGALKEPNLAKEAGQNLLAMGMAYARGDTGSIFSSLKKLTNVAMNGDKAYEKTKRTKTSPADVILWSGSRDDQTSADATIAAQATGAMSWAFITAIKQNPNQTYLGLLNSIRDVLQSKYTQKPQLSCSHPLGKKIRSNLLDKISFGVEIQTNLHFHRRRERSIHHVSSPKGFKSA